MTLQEFKDWLDNEIEMTTRSMNSKSKKIRRRAIIMFVTLKDVQWRLRND